MATDANRSKRLLEMIDLASVLLEAGSKLADAAFLIYVSFVKGPSTCIGQRVSTQ